MSIWAYTEAGLRVLSLYKIMTDGSCECGDDCKTVGKHPRIDSWQLSPQWSDEQLDAMDKAGHFDTGFGFILDDHLVIDIDPRNGGNESYKKLCADTDLDFEMLASTTVETGGGGKHIYFKRPSGLALSTKLKDYPGVDFKSSGFVVGAGSMHSSGATYEFDKCELDELTDAPDKLLELLRKKDTHRTHLDGRQLDVSESEIVDLLKYIEPDCDYETWIQVGMSIHHTTSGGGFSLFDEWSAGGKKYPGAHKLDKHWHSFGKNPNPIQFGTLFHFAKEGGFIPPARGGCFVQLLDEKPVNKLDISHIDLLRPPGFVGEVARYINNACLFPRERLAVASALHAVGVIGGLRYTDDVDEISTNLMMLCVSGSGTGKEAVQQAYIEIMSAVGIQRCLHGAIKSEQEMIRNLMRDQISNYLIDEYGYQLQKIENSRKRGGASYLEGVNAFQMSAFSKAHGKLLISGDLKDETRERLLKELAQLQNKIDQNEDKGGSLQKRADFLEHRAIPSIDSGIERPFFSLLGFTTPVSFDELVTVEQATNGFISRCVLIREPETNPKRKRGFKPTKTVNNNVKYTLQSLFNPAIEFETGTRIEYYDDKKLIPTELDAVELLDQVSEWVEAEAEKQKGRTGLEAIVRRGYELVAKVSTILAIPGRLRTTEHVLWAFAYMCEDLRQKLALAHANELEQSKQVDDRANALRERVLSVISNEDGETFSVMKQRICRGGKYAINDLKMIVDEMLEQKIIEKYKYKWNGRTSERFRKI